jgi:Ca2+-binding EF-hand superfamily protein
MTMKFWCAAALIVPVPAFAQAGGGQLPRAQMEGQIRANFARMDLNKDGFVTRQESAAARDTALMARMNAAFNTMDGDKNGSISRAEFIATNRGAISRATGGKPIPDRDFDGADTNKDGRVTVDESLAMPLRQFDAADANRDGMLSAAERQVAASRQRQRR